MRAHSLRVRLLIGAALWIVLALVLAGAAIVYLFTTNVDRGLAADLDASLKRVVASIMPEQPLSDIGQPLADPRFFTPFSGRYWQVEDLGSSELVRSQSLGDVVLAAAAEDRSGRPVTIAGPERQSLASLSRAVSYSTASGDRTYRITLAQDRKILDDAIGHFASDMSIALAVVALALIAAASLQVHLGLNPLGRVQEGVEAVRRGTADRLGGQFPAEVLALVGEVNELLAAREKSIEFARARAADLAHGLKTPLSVLSATSDHLRQAGDAQNADMLRDLAAEMTDRIDYQLRLAQLRLRTDSHVLNASLNNALLRTVSVLRKTHQGEALFWNVAFDSDVTVNIDRHDLLELAGILLENAAKWARTSVEVAAHVVEGFAEVTIADDGPGLTSEQVSELGDRGRRLDESRPGTGFGLSIAIQILAMNNGTIAFSRSDSNGGLQVVLRLPVTPRQP